MAAVNVVKHRTEVLSDKLQYVHSAPYCAGPKKRKFEKIEIDIMLEKKVIETTQVKRAVPIVFPSKKTNYYDSMLITEDFVPSNNEILTPYRVWINKLIFTAKLQYSPS